MQNSSLEAWFCAQDLVWQSKAHAVDFAQELDLEELGCPTLCGVSGDCSRRAGTRGARQAYVASLTSWCDFGCGRYFPSAALQISWKSWVNQSYDSHHTPC